MTVAGIVALITVAEKPWSDRDRKPGGYINYLHDYSTYGSGNLNLTACIYMHQFTFGEYRSTYTVCQTDSRLEIVNIYLNGSPAYFIDTQQWEVLKQMMTIIDASIHKAATYLANYVPDPPGR
jgi:hypothetical protein